MIAVCCAAINVEIMIDWDFEILIFHSHTDNKTWQKMIRNKHMSSKIRYDREEKFSMQVIESEIEWAIKI